MQLPFSKQLLAAAIIAIVAPSATVISAQSFSEFVSTPRPYIAAQNLGPQPAAMAPMTGPSSPGSFTQPSTQPAPTQPALGGGQQQQPLQPQQQQPPSGQQQPLGGQQPIGQSPSGGTVQPPTSGAGRSQPGTEGAQPPPVPGTQSQPFSGGGGGAAPPPPSTTAQPAGEQPRASNDLERCARDVLGDAFDAMKRGEVKMTDEQRKALNERCEQFKPAPKQQQQQFPGRGEFRGQTPSGQFPGQGQGLETAPGAPSGSGSSGSGGQQTCNVNGVEMPGPCSSYEQRGSSGSGNFEGPNGFEGPSDEDMERREKEQRGQMLREMKSRIREMETGVRMMTQGLRICTTAKIEVPSDVKDGIAKLQEMIAKVRKAEDPAELEDFDPSMFPEIGDRIRELADGCQRIRELPRMTKEITRGIKQIETEHRRITTQAKKAKLDVAEDLNQITQLIGVVKSSLAELGQVRDPAAAEEAFEKIDAIRDSMDDLREKIGAIRSVLDINKGLRDAKREITNAERRIKALERRKVNVTELRQLIAEGKSLVAQLTELAAQRPIDVDAARDAFEELMDLGNRAEEALTQAEGRRAVISTPSPGSKLKLDAFENFRRESAAPNAAEGSSDLESLLGF